MHKLVSIAAAALLGLAVYGGAVAPSLAHDDVVGAGLAGGVLGFMAGAAIASGHHGHVYVEDDGDGYGPPPPHWHHVGPAYGYGPGYGWHSHVRACFEAYGDNYDPRSDTFIGRDGYPHRCRL